MESLLSALLASGSSYHHSGNDLNFKPFSIAGGANCHFNLQSSPSVPFLGTPADPIADFNSYASNFFIPADQPILPASFNTVGSPQASYLSSVGGDGGYLKVEAKNSRKSCKSNTLGLGVKKRGTSTRGYTNIIKGQWTPQEDRKLMELVESLGTRKWAQIAERINGRVGKQCRERWHNHLKPDIKKDSWSEEEDKILIEIHKQIGNHWAEIAKRLPGRPENTIKNHWNATKRRQNGKRSRRSHLLHSYIRTVTSPPPDWDDAVFESVQLDTSTCGSVVDESDVRLPEEEEEGLLGMLVRSGTKMDWSWADMLTGAQGSQ